MSIFSPKPQDRHSHNSGNLSKKLAKKSDLNQSVESNDGKHPSPKPRRRKRPRVVAQTLNGIKRVSSTVIKPLIGPKAIYRRSWFWIGLGVGGSAIALGWGWQKLESSLPDSTKDVLTYVRDDTITIKAADSTIIQQIGPASHETLKIWEIPETLMEAFIAIEDQRFKEHKGVDSQGILRATVANLKAGGVVEGGSTITQQLARIVYFDHERSIVRKLKEMRMAQKIEQDLSKDQILERYLNLVYLGSGAYGIADAAWVYFSKPVKDLTLGEMATLAGLPPAPSVYSPLLEGKINSSRQKAAKERRDVVLQRMLENGYISQAEANKAMAEPLSIKPSQPKRLERKAFYFTEYIQQELPKYVSKEVLAKKGLTIETTINLEWQDAAETAVQKTMKTYGRYQRFGQAALVAVDPRNGQIKAMVGGKDFNDLDSNNYLNRVTQAQRQPGSTFKTFVYAAAVATGMSPYKGYMDAGYIVDGYEPKNYSERFRGSISVRDALISSINVVAVKTLVDVGWEPIIKLAQKMGIKSKLHPTYSLALGASEVNLLELTNSYGTLAAQGIHHDAHGIRRIIDQHGNVIYDHKVEGERAIDAETAAIVTWMLRGVVTGGTGTAAQIGRPAVGKTGTTDDARDLWFVGYIPQLVAGVWLGNDDNKPTKGSSATAAATWRQFMLEVIEDLDRESFTERPRKLSGREATIEAQPIKPKRVINKKFVPTTVTASTTRSRRRTSSRRGSSTRRASSTRRRSNRVRVSRKSSQPKRYYRRKATTKRSYPRKSTTRRYTPRNTAPRRSAPAKRRYSPAPARRRTAPARARRRPAPAPRVAPKPVARPKPQRKPAGGPLAPPAARK
ncbi:transglycosylase domain-containing protein [Moorena bouillonii]|uniref:transglycosylase domain-containing protein n=1 Tax=Moorena bouillonii TaxID=207920 RepID=UPI000AE07969|nr:penicillin-binding protein 1A [Moorena bouillonii]